LRTSPFTPGQLAAMALRVMNDLDKAGRSVWAVKLYEVRVAVAATELPKFIKILNRKARRYR
jgi:hypothetical protein